jgi:hypothetical protein
MIDITEIKAAINIVASALSFLFGAVSIKVFINAVKLFILHVMPLIKKSTQNDSGCPHHESVEDAIKDSRETKEMAIRTDEKVQGLQRQFENQETINREIFARLRDLEKR